MEFPVRSTFGLEDVPLAAAPGVTIRVLRLGMECAAPFGGGIWALALPVAVIDARAGRRHVRPVVDVTLGVLVVAAALSVVAGRFGRRRQNGG